MSSSFGTLFRVTTFGESHCRAVGCVVDGCPPRIALREEDIQGQLSRRRPGRTALTTPREEEDRVSILSGTEGGLSLGTPITLMVNNMDQRPGDYAEMASIPRPSHADFTYQEKYGVRAASGGGRSSARETIGRVAAGAIAEKILRQWWGIEIVAWVSSVGTVDSPDADMANISREEVDANIIRCPDRESAQKMISLVEGLKEAKDSTGGIVTCVCRNVPPGLGEPVFDRLEALLARAMLSIPSAKGFEAGSGFGGSRMRGSEHNDCFVRKEDGNGSFRLGTLTNNSGGIQGGISNGEHIFFRTAFKPPATIGAAQETAGFSGEPLVLEAEGRHDPCVVPRAVPIVESMAALVLLDLALIQEYRKR